MVALEWNVGSLRQRGLRFEELDADDRLAVLTHYYRRKLGAGHDALTGEAATAADLVAVARAMRGGKRQTAHPQQDSGLDGIKARLAEAVARGGGRGD